jgi:ribose transport system substrate-binding protein
VVYCQGSRELSYRQTRESIEFIPDLTSVFVSGAGLSGAACAVDDAGLSGKIKVVGYDTTESNVAYLKKGTVQFLIDQDPYQQGCKSVQLMADAIFQDGAVETDYYDTGIQIKNLYNC